MMKIKRQNKLGAYLAVTAGVGCAASAANAAVVFYGIDKANDTNNDPDGIKFGLFNKGGFYLYSPNFTQSTDAVIATSAGFDYFTGGGDLVASNGYSLAGYASSFGTGFSFQRGASAGSNNYANISFDGDDDVYEAVGQFYFDRAGGGYLIAIATTNAVPDPTDLSMVGGAALSISAGKAMIDAAAVPEPSSVALLALGSAGLLARRQRKRVA